MLLVLNLRTLSKGFASSSEVELRAVKPDMEVDVLTVEAATNTLIMGALLERFNGFSIRSSEEIGLSVSACDSDVWPGASTSMLLVPDASPSGPATSVK